MAATLQSTGIRDELRTKPGRKLRTSAGSEVDVCCVVSRRARRYHCPVGRHFSITTTVLLSLVLGAAAADAQNLVANPDFTSGIASWHLVGRGALAHGTDGANAPGSLQAAGGLAGNATQAVVGQCITSVSPAQILDFQAEVRVVSGSPSYCRIALFESDRPDCLWIELGSEVRRTTFSGGWDSLHGGTLTTSGGTRSIEVRLHCANAAGALQALDVRFDDIVVTPTGSAAEIFSDGFESGDTVRWSSTAP